MADSFYSCPALVGCQEDRIRLGANLLGTYHDIDDGGIAPEFASPGEDMLHEYRL